MADLRRGPAVARAAAELGLAERDAGRHTKWDNDTAGYSRRRRTDAPIQLCNRTVYKTTDRFGSIQPKMVWKLPKLPHSSYKKAIID